MFIDTVFYKEIPAEKMITEDVPTESMQYLDDLYTSYQIYNEMNKNSSVYNDELIASYLFENNWVQKMIHQSDYLLFASWSWMMNAKPGISKLRWKNKYQWSVPILDAQDCGSLCVYHAIAFLYQLNKSMKYNRYTCCTIENTLPYIHSIYPEKNYVGLLSFQKQNTRQSNLYVMHCEIAVEEAYFYCLNDLVVKLNSIAILYALDSKPYHIFVNNHVRHQCNSSHITALHAAIGSGFIYYILHSIQNGIFSVNTEFIYIIDFDYQTKSCGIFLIKIGK